MQNSVPSQSSIQQPNGSMINETQLSPKGGFGDHFMGAPGIPGQQISAPTSQVPDGSLPGVQQSDGSTVDKTQSPPSVGFGGRSIGASATPGQQISAPTSQVSNKSYF
jgi:hypothetical protein